MPFGIEKHYFVGLVFILLCACLWAGSSVLIQYIYSDLSFNSPFLLTYLATSLLVLHLPYHHGKELVLFHWKQTHLVDPTAALRDNSFAHQDYSLHNDDDPLIRPIAAIEIQNQQPSSSPERIPSTADSTVSVTEQQAAAKAAAAAIDSSPFATDYEALKLSLIIAPMWFLANCLYNYSLLMTTVSSSTVISNLSAAFTLLFSSFLRLEQASYVKIVGVVICFVGAITTGLADSGSGGNDDGPNHTVGGDIVAVLGAAGYGLYTTTIRYLVPEDESEADDDSDTTTTTTTTTTTRRSGDDVEGAARTASASASAAATVSALHDPHHSNSNDSNNNSSSSHSDSHPPTTQTKTKRRPVSMHLLLGYIGLVNALLLAPVVGIMFAVHWSGVSGISGAAVGVVCANGMADTVIADYFWARAVLLTSPTVATIGMSITIPIALVTDYAVDHIVPGGVSVFGALLVVVGFVLVNLTNDQVAHAARVTQTTLRRLWVACTDEAQQ